MFPSNSIRHRVFRTRRHLRIAGLAWTITWVFLSASSSFADSELELSKTSSKEFDVATEVRGFVQSLIARNPQVKARFEELTAEARAEAGGRFSLGKLNVIEWLVPNFENRFQGGKGERDGEYVFLVQQQLVSGFHHGYSVADNVTSQVRVILHSEFREDQGDPSAKEGFVLTSNELTMKFEGFVTVSISPVK